MPHHCSGLKRGFIKMFLRKICIGEELLDGTGYVVDEMIQNLLFRALM